jgi:hypothetical protein
MKGDIVRPQALQGSGGRSEVINGGLRALAIDRSDRAGLAETGIPENGVLRAGALAAGTGFGHLQSRLPGAKGETARLAQALCDDLDVRGAAAVSARGRQWRRQHQCDRRYKSKSNSESAPKTHGIPLRRLGTKKHEPSNGSKIDLGASRDLPQFFP